MLGPALRMVVSLAIVLALMYIAARLLQRTHGGGAPRSNSRRFATLASSVKKNSLLANRKTGRRAARRRAHLDVVARQPLGKSASVAVVRVGDRTMLIGITEANVQLLSEVDAALFEETETTSELVELAAAPAAGEGSRDSSRVGSRNAVSVMDLLRERTVRRA
jgi:flagellar protein FliO/FliZ